jgi:hypothetical protein
MTYTIICLHTMVQRIGMWFAMACLLTAVALAPKLQGNGDGSALSSLLAGTLHKQQDFAPRG